MSKFWDEPDDEDKSKYDDIYTFNRESAGRADVREFVENLYQRYLRFCGDPNFARKMRHEFNACTLQMYSGIALLEAGHVLEKADAEGPDHKALIAGRRVWVECIAREPGTGAERPRRKMSYQSKREEHVIDGQTFHTQHGLFRPDDKGIALRLTGAIWEKVKKHRQWVADEVISPNDPYVIAVGAGLIQDADLHGAVPRIVQVLYGLDDLGLIVTPYSEEPPRVAPTFRNELEDSKGGPIPLTGFLDANALPEVSAVMFCAQGAWNPPRRIGHDIVTVYNAVATHKLSPGSIPLGREYYVEDDHFRSRDHREHAVDVPEG